MTYTLLFGSVIEWQVWTIINHKKGSEAPWSNLQIMDVVASAVFSLVGLSSRADSLQDEAI